MRAIEQLTDHEKAIMFMVEAMQELVEDGLLTGCRLDLGDPGRILLEQIKATGWTPTDEQMRAAMDEIMAFEWNKRRAENN